MTESGFEMPPEPHRVPDAVDFGFKCACNHENSLTVSVWPSVEWHRTLRYIVEQLLLSGQLLLALGLLAGSKRPARPRGITLSHCPPAPAQPFDSETTASNKATTRDPGKDAGRDKGPSALGRPHTVTTAPNQAIHLPDLPHLLHPLLQHRVREPVPIDRTTTVTH